MSAIELKVENEKLKYHGDGRIEADKQTSIDASTKILSDALKPITLTDRIKRALEFDYSNSRIAYQKHEFSINQTISQHTYWTEGQRAENARLLPLLLAMKECAEVLREIRPPVKSEDDPALTFKFSILERADKALAGLERVIGETEK